MVERDFHTIDGGTIHFIVMIKTQNMFMEGLCICNVFFAKKDHVLVMS